MPAARPSKGKTAPPSDSGTGEAKGFRVGPGRAQGRYTGHADKIKSTLIHKANVKKAYARTLLREGYGEAKAEESAAVERPGDGEQPVASSSQHPRHLSTSRISPTPVSTSTQRSRKGKERAVELPRVVDKPAPRFPHPPETAAEPSRPKRKSPEEIEGLKKRRKDEQSAWHKRRPDGKVDQASRMGVLLKRVERSVSSAAAGTR